MRSPVFKDLLLVFVLAFAVRVVWAVFIPPWDAPDEPDHYQYVAFLAEHVLPPHLPLAAAPYYSVEQVTHEQLSLVHQIPGALAYPMDSYIYRYYPINHDYDLAQGYSAPISDRQSTNAARTTSYPPLYYAIAAVPWRIFWDKPILTRLYLVRCVAAVFGAFACVFAYLFAYELRGKRVWGWALGMSMAFMPMFIFDTAIANNDATMNCIAGMLLWFLVRTLRRLRITWQDGWIIGIMSGLLLVAKPTGLVLIGIAIAVVISKMLQLRERSWQTIRAKVLTLGGTILGILAVYGPWLTFRLHYYGDTGIDNMRIPALLRVFDFLEQLLMGSSIPVGAAGLSTTVAETTYPLSSYIVYLHQQGEPYFYWLLVKTVWGYFGWLDLPMPDAAYTGVVILGLVGCIGLIIQVVRQRTHRRSVLFLLSIVGAQAVFLFICVDYFVSFRQQGITLGLQGRYFFPVLMPVLFLQLSGWDDLLPKHSLALRIAPYLMLVLQFIALATVLHTYYGVNFG